MFEIFIFFLYQKPLFIGKGSANVNFYKTMIGLDMFLVLEVRYIELIDRKLGSQYLFLFVKS